MATFEDFMKLDIRVNVYVKNERAITFYEKEGFKIVKEEIGKTTDEKEYVMTWEK